MQALKLLQMESQRRCHLLRSPFPTTTTEVHGNSIVGTILSVALLSARRVLSYTGQLLGGFFSPSKFTNENSLFRFNKTRMCRYALWHEVKRCYFLKNKNPENRLNCYKEGNMPGPAAPGWWKDTGTVPGNMAPSQGLGWGVKGPSSPTSYPTLLCLQSSRDHSHKSRQEQRRGLGQGAEGEGQGSVGKDEKNEREREKGKGADGGGVVTSLFP